MPDASPVTSSEFTTLMRPFGAFEARPVLAVAVSGGRDSRALALLARQWAARRQGRAVGLVVDHGLREESAAEAEQTRVWLEKRGLDACVLRWERAMPLRGAIQARARAARYRLMLDWCRDNGVLHLLTAHQADDQAETHVLRQARGSGPAGLAAMSAVVEYPEARLLRPLLPVSRARLTATLEAAGEKWIEDPSNADPRYARGRLRRDGLPVAAATILRRVVRTALRRVAAEVEAAACMAGCSTPHPLGGVLIDHDPWRRLEAAAAGQVVAAAVATVAGGDYPPRRERTGRAVRQMRAPPSGPGCPPPALTLGGCRILWRRGGWLVVREPASIRPDEAEEGILGRPWDGRFEIRAVDRVTAICKAPLAAGLAPGVIEAARRLWPATAGLSALLGAAPAVVVDGGKAISVEGGWEEAIQRQECGPSPARACFRPRRPLAGGPFFPCFAVSKGQIVNL